MKVEALMTPPPLTSLSIPQTQCIYLQITIYFKLIHSIAGMILRNHTYLKVHKCWQILLILKMPTIK